VSQSIDDALSAELRRYQRSRKPTAAAAADAAINPLPSFSAS